MIEPSTSILARRGFLAGGAALAVATLPGCTSMGGFSLTEAIRRLLMLSAENAFARLTAPGGFWDSQVARLALPEVFGSRGGVLERILTSGPVRDRLQRELNYVAEAGASRAAPIVAETVRTIGIQNAVDLVRGGPSAASLFLRQSMAGSLVEVMLPALGDGLRVARDPIVGQALAALTGVDVGKVSYQLSVQADEAIWGEIGRQEAEIRAHPESTRDPVLIGVFGMV